MSTSPPEVVSRYFELDAVRDIDSILSLFADDATVVDEGEARQGAAAIRAWQTGPASKFTYTTDISGSETIGPNRYRVSARLTGDFPGGTADLTFDFTVANDRIVRLVIAPAPAQRA